MHLYLTEFYYYSVPKEIFEASKKRKAARFILYNF